MSLDLSPSETDPENMDHAPRHTLSKQWEKSKRVVPLWGHLLSEGYSSTVSTSRELQEAILMPPKRQSSAIMADSLLPNDRKKQLIQEITLEPAAEGKGREEEGLLDL